MNQLSCDICLDLMPLVRDGIASDDSTQAVLDHIAACSHCARAWEGETVPELKSQAVYQKLRQRLRLFSSMVLVLGLMVGLSLFSGAEIFSNILLLPLLGALSYWVFRWRSLLVLPLVLTATVALYAFVKPDLIQELPSNTVLMLLFLLLGIVIAGLLHFALKKEEKP